MLFAADPVDLRDKIPSGLPEEIDKERRAIKVREHVEAGHTS